MRGVGQWTVEMLLIFTLGRPDVLPVDDFGVREGFKIAYGRRKQPTPKQLRRYRRALEAPPLDRGLVPLARGREGAAPQDRARGHVANDHVASNHRAGGRAAICSGVMP